jgi:hypothetical protein
VRLAQESRSRGRLDMHALVVAIVVHGVALAVISVLLIRSLRAAVELAAVPTAMCPAHAALGSDLVAVSGTADPAAAMAPAVPIPFGLAITSVSQADC